MGEFLIGLGTGVHHVAGEVAFPGEHDVEQRLTLNVDEHRQVRAIGRDLVPRVAVCSRGDAIDLFAATGLDEARLDVSSEEFLGRVAAFEQKNLVIETLRKLFADQVDVVQSKRFREVLEDGMVR